MDKQLIISLLLVVLFVAFGALLLKTLPIADMQDDEINIFTPAEVVAGFIYEDGLHEYTGSLDFPNGCYELDAHAIVMESYPEQVVLVFESTNNEGPDVACTQAIKTIPFRILFSASELATVTARYNNERIDLLIIQNEALDMVEVLEEEENEEGDF